MDEGQGDPAGTGVFAGEGDLDVLRCQEVLVLTEVVGQGMGGDAGDADFVE